MTLLYLSPSVSLNTLLYLTAAFAVISLWWFSPTSVCSVLWDASFLRSSVLRGWCLSWLTYNRIIKYYYYSDESVLTHSPSNWKIVIRLSLRITQPITAQHSQSAQSVLPIGLRAPRDRQIHIQHQYREGTEDVSLADHQDSQTCRQWTSPLSPLHELPPPGRPALANRYREIHLEISRPNRTPLPQVEPRGQTHHQDQE